MSPWFAHSIASYDDYDTFVVTGDIDAMWLRDSTNQVMPLLQLVNQDENLDALIVGLVQRQVSQIAFWIERLSPTGTKRAP